MLFFPFGCAIYTFVFAAVDVPLYTRSISAVTIIPVKKVKTSPHLVLPTGIFFLLPPLCIGCHHSPSFPLFFSLLHPRALASFQLHPSHCFQSCRFHQ